MLRLATAADLAAINQVIEAAIMSWDLPERVKRLSIPSYRYDEADLLHLTLWAAEAEVTRLETACIVAVAGYEPADPTDTPPGIKGLLLHGLYVSPSHQGKGLGKCLLQLVEHNAAEQSYAGVLVKAQSESVGFFTKLGYEALPIEDSARHYSHRLWRAI